MVFKAYNGYITFSERRSMSDLHMTFSDDKMFLSCQILHAHNIVRPFDF